MLPVFIVISYISHFEVLIHSFKEEIRDIISRIKSFNFYIILLEEFYSQYIALLQSLEINMVK
jgi:hypothetical protein